MVHKPNTVQPHFCKLNFTETERHSFIYITSHGDFCATAAELNSCNQNQGPQKPESVTIQPLSREGPRIPAQSLLEPISSQHLLRKVFTQKACAWWKFNHWWWQVGGTEDEEGGWECQWHQVEGRTGQSRGALKQPSQGRVSQGGPSTPQTTLGHSQANTLKTMLAESEKRAVTRMRSKYSLRVSTFF